MSGRPRVVHVITALGSGGGETLLVRLLGQLGEEARQSHAVVSLRELGLRGSLAPEIEALGVPVTGLDLTGMPSWRDPARLRCLSRTVAAHRADLVQTWMLHSNVLAGLTVRLSPRAPVVWGVHVSDVSRATLGLKAVGVQRVEAALSWVVPSRIIACSEASAEVMRRLPYRRARVRTIPNGFDVDTFRPDPEAGAAVRAELGISPQTTTIGHFARRHPIKGHPLLLEAAGEAIRSGEDAVLLLFGDGLSESDPELAPLLRRLGAHARVVGRRDDVPRALNAVDIAVSSSYGEALPLAVGEAMATGIPVIATDAGDSAELVGDGGRIVPIGDPHALGAALRTMIDLGPDGRAGLGAMARRRIVERYSMARMATGYERTWVEALDQRRG